MEVQFLTLDEVLEIHRDQIERYGGAYGIRDFGLLQSAVETPMTQFDGNYLHPDPYTMAAAYLFHIAQNHPFIDGNKRTALVSTLWFLLLNDIEIIADESDLEEMVMAVARGELGKEDIANFFADNSRE
jgi:death-on-curing protein